ERGSHADDRDAHRRPARSSCVRECAGGGCSTGSPGTRSPGTPWPNTGAPHSSVVLPEPFCRLIRFGVICEISFGDGLAEDGLAVSGIGCPFIVLAVGVRSGSVGAGTGLCGAGWIWAGILLAGAGGRPIGRLVFDGLTGDRVPRDRLTAGRRQLRGRN